MRPVTGITILGFRLGVIALAIYWLALFAGTHWPAGIALAPEVSDKTKHFVGFFGLAILCCYVTQSKPNDWSAAARRFGAIIAILVVYACLDEFTQRYSPGRTPDVLDVVADALGVTIAVLLYAAGSRIYAIAQKGERGF